MSSSTISTPRILATAVLKNSAISIPRILVTVVPSTAKSFYCDTDVHTQKDTVQYHDTSVKIEASKTPSYYFDTYTHIKQDIEKSLDTVVKIKTDIRHYYDSSVTIKGNTVHYYDTFVSTTTRQQIMRFCDTHISATADTMQHFETCVSIPHDTSFATDTFFSDPFKPVAQREKFGMVSISLTLQELTLADTFTLETTDDINILDYVNGKILDFPYLYRVGETSQQGMVVTAKGMYDVDKILYQSINYNYGNQQHTLIEHAEYIANALGKSLVYNADSFKHSQKWIGDGQTYESIISSLFGWSSSIPHKAINVFMRARDNSLNVIQRGNEQTTIDISDTSHTRPVTDRRIERTMINFSNSNGIGNNTGSLYIEPLPFWGTLRMGDVVCSYESGYLTSEENQGNITTYEYTGDDFDSSKYLHRKTTQHTDGSKTVTSYDYSKSKSGLLVLGCETETTTDKDGNSTVRKTVHAPLGGGFYGTSVYIDGEYQGSSIGTGSPAAVASRYLANQESITLGGANYGDNSNPLGNGDSLIEAVNVPTENKDIINRYLAELKWLNRKIRETVSMDIYNYYHVIDFTEKVKFRGHEYYLVSNTISQTTRELKQSVQLVRWY